MLFLKDNFCELNINSGIKITHLSVFFFFRIPHVVMKNMPGFGVSFERPGAGV